METGLAQRVQQIGVWLIGPDRQCSRTIGKSCLLASLHTRTTVFAVSARAPCTRVAISAYHGNLAQMPICIPRDRPHR